MPDGPHFGTRKVVILDFRCTSAVKSPTSRCVPAVVLVTGLEHSDVDYGSDVKRLNSV
jgi:hypothetical protein